METEDLFDDETVSDALFATAMRFAVDHDQITEFSLEEVEGIIHATTTRMDRISELIEDYATDSHMDGYHQKHNLQSVPLSDPSGLSLAFSSLSISSNENSEI